MTGPAAWSYDGWGARFRFGVVTPHADVGPEAEAQAMLAGLAATVHGERVDFSPMHPGGTIDAKIEHDPVRRFVDPSVIGRAVESLSSSPLDAIGLAFTSSSFMIGADREGQLLNHLRGVSHGIPLQTTGTAAVAAIAHLGLERVAVMAPSWFDDELCRHGRSYFASQGVDVVCSTPSGPDGGPLAITAETMAGAVVRLVEASGAEAVFVAGNGQRAIGAIDHVERSLGITMLTANQVLLWACLGPGELRRRISGYGTLFGDRGAGERQC